MNGDSLAERTRPHIPRELPGWRVRQSTKVSRHAHEGAGVMRRYGRSLPRVIHVSLGTNERSEPAGGVRDAIADVMDVAVKDEARDNLIVVNSGAAVRPVS